MVSFDQMEKMLRFDDWVIATIADNTYIDIQIRQQKIVVYNKDNKMNMDNLIKTWELLKFLGVKEMVTGKEVMENL